MIAVGNATGLIAAALAALYPNVWLYDREVLSEPLSMLLVALTIFLAYGFIERPNVARAIGLSAVCTVLAQTRSEQILLLPLLVLPLVLRARIVPLKQRFVWVGAAASTSVVLLAPWSLYNASRFERPVLLSDQFGAGLLQSNCDPTYHGERLGSVDGQCAAKNRPELRLHGDESERDAQMRSKALHYIRANLSRVPVVVLALEGRVWNVFRVSQQMQIDTARSTTKRVIKLGYVAYWVLMPFAVAGAVVMWRRRIALLPVLVFPAIVVVAVAVQYGYTRYRAPAEVSIVILAAVAFDAILRRLRRSPVTTGRVLTLPDEEPSEILSRHG